MSIFARKQKEVRLREMTVEDIEEVREVGQIAWSDLAMHDIGRKFKYPKRSEKIIDAYLWKDPGGCMVAEEDGKIVGSAFSHVWGRVGWIGPLEVLPSHQDHGIGKELLNASEGYLNRRGCEVIGLETMAHLPKHLHFYMSSGYRPGATTLIMEKVLRLEGVSDEGIEEITVDDLDHGLRSVAFLSEKVNDQLDYSAEAESILRKGLGRIFVLRKEGIPLGCALLHTYQRGEEAAYSSIKALLIDPRAPDPPEVCARLLGNCEQTSLESGKGRLLTRFSAGDLRLYQLMLGRAYALKGANTRMVKKGEYIEQGGFNLSSWAG